MLRTLRLCWPLAAGLFLLSIDESLGREETPSARTVVAEPTVSPLQRGIIPSEARAPSSARYQRRGRTRQPSSIVIARAGRAGATYVPGKVIVKFRSSVTSASCAAALSRAPATARAMLRSARPAHANFDVVDIEATEDAEAVADALGRHEDVEYAQAAYRVHRQFVPNDRFYPRQWNLALLDLERAWDIQPDAASAIVVAVLDTGVAYTDASITAHAFARSRPRKVQSIPPSATSPFDSRRLPSWRLQPDSSRPTTSSFSHSAHQSLRNHRGPAS